MKKIFILIGATGNLGNDAVKYFAQKDYDKFYFVARNDFMVEASINDFVKIICGDLSVESNVEEVFSKIAKEPEAEYYLFDTIGGFAGGYKIWETDYEVLNRMININLISAFLIAKHFANLVKNSKGGSICFMSAESSFKYEIDKYAYGMTKNAVNYLIKSLAVEGKEINLTANGIAPFAINTVENREWINDYTKLVTTQNICCKAYELLAGYPEISGEIIPL